MIIKIRTSLLLSNSPAEKSVEITDELLKNSTLKIPLREYYELFFDICNVSFGHTGLVYSLDALSELLVTVCSKHDIRDDQKIILFDALKSFSGDVRIHDKFSGLAYQNENIVIYFLNSRRDQILKTPDGENRWNELLLAGFLATRRAVIDSVEAQREFFERTNLTNTNPATKLSLRTDEQMLEYSRAIIKVLLYLDLNLLDSPSPNTLEESHIKMAIAQAAKVGKPFKTMKDSYEKWAAILFNNGFPNRKRLSAGFAGFSSVSFENQLPLNAATISQIEREIAGIYKHSVTKTPRQITEAEILRKYEWREWQEQKNERIKDGESVDEILPLPSESEKFNLKAALGKYALFTRPLGWKPPHNRYFLTLENVGVIISFAHHQATENDENSTLYSELTAFLLIQLFFGFNDKFLIGAKLADTNNSISVSDETPLVYSTDGYFHIKPQKYDGKAAFGTLKVESAGNYLEGGDTVAIPVGEILKNTLNQVVVNSPQTNGNLFSFSNTNEFNKILNPIRMILHQKFDLKKFGDTAFKHLVETGKMDDLSAAFVSGFIPQKIGAQPHYRNIKVENLIKSHSDSAKKVWETVNEASESVLACLKMPLLSEIGYPNQLLELPDFVKAQKRFGSFYVPKNSAAKNYLFPLNDFIKNCSNPIQKFNCHSAFTALLLMYLTGMRAVEVGRLDLSSFYQTDREDIVFIVDGKSNRYFDEYRIAYLDAAYSLIIKKYQENTQKILDQIYNEFAVFPSVAAQERNNKLFFFLKDNGEILEFASAELNRKLKNDFPLYGNIPVYEFRINAPRQFFATVAADLGISRRLIDSLMGHTSRGREPLFRFSDLAFEEIKSASREVSGKIADLLDFNKLLNQIKVE